MSRYKRVAITGTGTMGPGMGAVLAAGGHGSGHVRRQHRGPRPCQGRLRPGLGRARPPRDADRGRRLGALRHRPGVRSRRCRVRRRGHPRAARSQAERLRRVRAPGRPRCHPRLQHLGHPGHQDRRQPRAPGAGGGDALVQSAPSHPHDRDRARREDLGGRPSPASPLSSRTSATTRACSRRRSRASSRTASCTPSCASAWRWWTRASSGARSWTST